MSSYGHNTISRIRWCDWSCGSWEPAIFGALASKNLKHHPRFRRSLLFNHEPSHFHRLLSHRWGSYVVAYWAWLTYKKQRTKCINNKTPQACEGSEVPTFPSSPPDLDTTLSPALHGKYIMTNPTFNVEEALNKLNLSQKIKLLAGQVGCVVNNTRT